MTKSAPPPTKLKEDPTDGYSGYTSDFEADSSGEEGGCVIPYEFLTNKYSQASNQKFTPLLQLLPNRSLQMIQLDIIKRFLRNLQKTR